MNIKILFLGDSITAGFNISKYFPAENFTNKAVSGDSTIECLERIEDSIGGNKFDLVFICIGTNDIARGRSVEEISELILEVIKKVNNLLPDSKIIITSIFPTKNNSPRPNRVINAINEMLKNAAERSYFHYFHLHSFFTDEKGDLKKEFTEDGLHLTEKAYEKWASVLRDFFRGFS